MNKELKDKLLSEVVWTNTRQGAFQRSFIYNKNIPSDLRRRFKKKVKKYLYENLFQEYKNKKITEYLLIQIIDKFIEDIKMEFKGILKDGDFQFGNAQKFINLYLKSMWIIGELQTPPHFPVDRIIQRKLKLRYNWTNMSKEEYMDVIIKAKDKIKNNNEYDNIAEWEASIYYKDYLEN